MKKFLIRHWKKTFDVLVSPANHNFVGSIVYRDEPLRWQVNDLSITRFPLKGEHFFNTTEQNVFQDCISWIEKNFGKEFTVDKAELN